MADPKNPLRAPDALSYAALRLKKAAPEQFDAFVKALLTTHEQTVSDMTGAPPETVLVHQGRVQQTQRMLRVFKECHLFQ